MAATQAAGQLTTRDAKVMFELSTYDNTESARQILVLDVDDAPIAAVRNWESEIDPGRLSSSLSQYGLRVKVTALNVWRNGELVDMPPNIRGRLVNVKVSFSGVWHT